jgi:hypothetical protein
MSPLASVSAISRLWASHASTLNVQMTAVTEAGVIRSLASAYVKKGSLAINALHLLAVLRPLIATLKRIGTLNGISQAG